MLALFGLATGAATVGAEALRPGLAELIHTEQQRLSRDVNEQRIISPAQNGQDPRYAPEAGNTFEIESYWIDADKVDQFDSGGFPAALRGVLTRKAGGKAQVRLLVHPESRAMYAPLVRTAQRAPSFKGTATSSSRTLLVWEDGKEASAFFAKLSLDATIGGASRTVSSSQVVRSVGISKILEQEGGALPESFGYFPEPWGFVPKGMNEAGMLIRTVPDDVASGKTRLVPLFSLYAEPGDGGEPLLRGMIRRSGMAGDVFVKEKILRPFARQWAQLVFEHGVTSEPHAQNVLMEIDQVGQPTGRFFHRDFGGFAADLAYREQIGMSPIANLPVLTTVAEDYRAERTRGDLANLERYFAQGFVYNVDKALVRWGMAPANDNQRGALGRMRGWLGGGRSARDRNGSDGVAMQALAQVTAEEFGGLLGTSVSIPDFQALQVTTQGLREVAVARLAPTFASRRAARAARAAHAPGLGQLPAEPASALVQGTRARTGIGHAVGNRAANDNRGPARVQKRVPKQRGARAPRGR